MADLSTIQPVFTREKLKDSCCRNIQDGSHSLIRPFFMPTFHCLPQRLLFQEREAVSVQTQQDLREQSVSHSIQTWRLAAAARGHRREHMKVGYFQSYYIARVFHSRGEMRCCYDCARYCRPGGEVRVSDA